MHNCSSFRQVFSIFLFTASERIREFGCISLFFLRKTQFRSCNAQLNENIQQFLLQFCYFSKLQDC